MGVSGAPYYGWEFIISLLSVGRIIHEEVEGPGVSAPRPLSQPQTSDFYDDVLRSFSEHISSLVAPQDMASGVVLFPSLPTDSLPQISPSLQNGVCIPQRVYEKGAGRDIPDNRNLVLFVRQDGSYILVPAAMGGDYVGLVNRDLPALTGAGVTITLRFEVCDTSRTRQHTGAHLLHSGLAIHQESGQRLFSSFSRSFRKRRWRTGISTYF